MSDIWLGGRLKFVAVERELAAGLLSRDANFRLIVSGMIGVKEIERLISKLKFDMEILDDDGGEVSLRRQRQQIEARLLRRRN